MRIDRPGGRSCSAPSSRSAALAAAGRSAVSDPARRSPRILPLFLPRSGAGSRRLATTRSSRRPTAACWSPARRTRRRGAAGHVAADQHLPVADGRAREPHAGVGPRHARGVSRRASSCPRTGATRAPPTSAARSGSITRPAIVAARSSASWRAASSAACRRAPSVHAAIGSAS